MRKRRRTLGLALLVLGGWRAALQIKAIVVSEPPSAAQTSGTPTSFSSINAPSIYLVSLRYDIDRVYPQQRELWRWKDTVLGDGRDYFVPKPKTLRKLQRYLTQTKDGKIDSCVVLSNCARLEILLRSTPGATPKDIVRSLSMRLLSQTRSSRTARFHWPMVDWPGLIELEAAPLDDSDDECELDSRHWTVLQTEQNILEHLCEISAGLAPRPRRPNRPTIFRPFSSRDAHILLQLKRTVDICDDTELKRLLQASLCAGKAARTTSIVESLGQLRPYGSGDTKYDTQPPSALLETVVQDVHSLAIAPVVQDYLDDLYSRGNKDAIVHLREAALALAASKAERSFIQRRLHEPTLQLRRGDFVDTNGVLQQIQKDLEAERRRMKSNE